MKPIQIISQDLFDKVRSRFSNLEMGDESGGVTIDPAEARFFDFDFTVENAKLGRVSISLNDLGSLKVYYSQGITENQDEPIKKEWYNFLKEMRFFAMRRLLRFDTRDIAKTNLDKNDFQHLATTQGTKEDEMNMNESKWNHKSTKKTSRAVKGRTEVIVRHHQSMEEMYPGARSQRKNIKAIFIQNRDGERFKYPFIHTAGAFAMAQHVDHGGVPHDPAGKSIIRMSEQIAQLQEFQRKIHRSTLHDDALGITERAIGRLNDLKATVDALGKRHHYENWMAEFQGTGNENVTELDAVAMEEYKSKFTQTSFQEELTDFFPLLHSIMSETNTIDLEDYVKEEADESTSVEKIKDRSAAESIDYFEEWADATEQGQVNVEELKQALDQLPQGQDGPELEFGANGETAWDFFQGVGIDNEDLKVKIDAALELNGNEGNAIDAFKSWAKENQPDLLAQLGMEDTKQPEAPTGAAPKTENDEMSMHKGNMEDKTSMVKEVAKIVKSFYNAANESVGPFRAPENICLDVKKQIAEKFGEQAGEQAHQMAEAFIQKLTQEWEENHGKSSNLQSDGLNIDRLKELVGNIKQKVEAIGDQGPVDKNIMPAVPKVCFKMCLVWIQVQPGLLYYLENCNPGRITL